MANLFLDFTSGNNSNDGTTFANRFQNFTAGATAARIAPGDVIRCMKSTDPTALGSCTWTNASASITIPAGTILDIHTCESTWTAVSANVTQATSALRKQGSNSVAFTIAGAFTTGQVAYSTFAAKDCSAFDTLSMILTCNTASIAANTFRIDLCSDTLGATPVNSFTIDFALAATGDIYTSFVKSKGSALGASIQSIALVALLDPGAGAVILRLDNIIVSKSPSSADCLTHQSLISKTSAPVGGTDVWYAIKSITATTVVLEDLPSSDSTTNLLYPGTTQTLTSYVRQPILITTGLSGGIWNAVQDSGTLGNLITFSGGWDTTAMTSQTGQTFVTFPYYETNYAFATGTNTYVSLEKLGAAKSYIAFNHTNQSHIEYTDCWAVCTVDRGFYFFSGDSCKLTRCYSISGSSSQGLFHHSSGAGAGISFDSCTALGNASGYGFALYASTTVFRDCYAIQNSSYGLSIQYAPAFPCVIDRLTTSGNATAGILLSAQTTGSVVGNNCVLGETTEVSTSAAFIYHFASNNHDDVDGATTIFAGGYRATTDATTRHTASGYSWKLSPTTAAFIDAAFPARLLIGTRVLTAGTTYTIGVWVNRDNTGITAKLVVPTFARVITTEQSATAVAAANGWEQLTVSVTPAVTGVAEIYVYAYGGSTFSVYVDDLSVA